MSYELHVLIFQNTIYNIFFITIPKAHKWIFEALGCGPFSPSPGPALLTTIRKPSRNVTRLEKSVITISKKNHIVSWISHIQALIRIHISTILELSSSITITLHHLPNCTHHHHSQFGCYSFSKDSSWRLGLFLIEQYLLHSRSLLSSKVQELVGFLKSLRFGTR